MAEDEPAGQADPSGEPADAEGDGERPPPASASESEGVSERDGAAADEQEQHDQEEQAEQEKQHEEEAGAADGGETHEPDEQSRMGAEDDVIASEDEMDVEDEGDEGEDGEEGEEVEDVEEGEDAEEGEEISADPGDDENRGIPFTPMGPQVSVLPPERRVEAPIGAVMQANKAETGREGDDVPEDVRKYQRFKKVDGAQYERVNQFLRERTYVTAREWAIARLCSDFRTETGIEMTKIGENLPHLVPFMTDSYTPQAVNQARSSFETKVRKSGATFLYGAMSDFFTADELDDIMYEVTEVAKFLLEVEGVDLAVDEELEGEERISSVMREVRSSSDQLRHEGTTCPNCGHEIGGEGQGHEH